MKLILASQSPRRKELLEKEGIPFEVHPSNIEEVFDDRLELDEALIKVAEGKAKDVQDLYPECVILSADTIVVSDGKILGKPKNIDQAREILHSLSGREHMVKTGVCLLGPYRKESFVETTSVHFRNLSDWEIENYIKKGTCLDKAGAYGIQECDFVDWIDGDFDNVVGLPVKKVKELL